MTFATLLSQSTSRAYPWHPAPPCLSLAPPPLSSWRRRRRGGGSLGTNGEESAASGCYHHESQGKAQSHEEIARAVRWGITVQGVRLVFSPLSCINKWLSVGDADSRGKQQDNPGKSITSEWRRIIWTPWNSLKDANSLRMCNSCLALLWREGPEVCQRPFRKMGNVMRGVIALIPSERCQRFLVGDLKEMPLDRTLDLSSRQLRRVPLAACVFDELVKLYLSDNNLSTLPADLQGLRKLQLLALDFNCFEELPLAVCKLPQLSILYLGNNRLYYLPSELTVLKELNTLWLETNCFTVFPEVVCELSNLKTLHLGYNQIKSLPQELGQLQELRSIWLAGNQLTEFPSVLLEMHFLAVIDVDRNKIRRFPALSHMQGLKLVIYDHNPCANAPVVGEGVRRVGRWADCANEAQDEEVSKAASETTAEVLELQPEEEHNI